LAAALAVLVLLVGCSSSGAQRPEPSPAARSPTSDRAAGGAEAARGFQSVRGYRATAIPVRIEIPTIHVASALDRLGRAPDGTIQEPSRWDVPG